MTSALVTGVAGFIGSHLAERLVSMGYHVLGVDSFTEYYPRRVKLSNIAALRKEPNFEFIDGDLNQVDLPKIVGKVEHVFHLAAQPGVRPSWGASFDRYVDDNIRATQRLLEACKGSSIKKMIYASSSSVYGNAETFPTGEDVTPAPVSPYGATKSAAELLCRVYLSNFNIPTVILRYFTVYGPRQRPDMAFHRFISKVTKGEEIEVFGDGSQERDFTFVGDTVSATVFAMEAKKGSVYNVGTGRTVSLKEAISLIQEGCAKKAKIVFRDKAAGDVARTSADISRIKADLGYDPKVSLAEGLRRQVEWQLGGEGKQATLDTSKARGTGRVGLKQRAR